MSNDFLKTAVEELASTRAMIWPKDAKPEHAVALGTALLLEAKTCLIAAKGHSYAIAILADMVKELAIEQSRTNGQK